LKFNVRYSHDLREKNKQGHPIATFDFIDSRQRIEQQLVCDDQFIQEVCELITQCRQRLAASAPKS